MTGPSMLPQSERVRLRVLWSCVRFVHEEDPMLLLILIACNAVPAGSAAQADPWAAPLRGSWVRTGPAATGDVVLASHDSGVEIVVGAAENLNVRQAAAFLAGDIETISGYRPPIVSTPTTGRTSIRLATEGNGPLPAAIDAAALRGQWESYRVVTAPRTVWLVGSNPRGTAFAAYTLSERLGVDPLYLWTGYVPEHRDPLVLKGIRFAQGPPTFRYRGFFHDDEDILPRPFDARGYPLQTGDVPLAWYRRFFEAALRLRMNMVAPYVRVHRRFEVQQLASDWGLYYTSHHYDILVSNPFGLVTFNLAAERGVRPDYDWFTNRDGLLTFWRGGVADNPDLDVLWPVGLPTDLGRWKHGVYYHLAYLGGNLSKQTTHLVAPATIAREFQRIVQARATEYMLVNVSELRDYIMGARLIADITWNAPAVYASPDPAGRFMTWWTQEYFAPAAAPARAAYDRYHALLDTPDKLWYASDAVQNLIERLWNRVAARPFTPFNADTLAVLQARLALLDTALATTVQAAATLTLAQQRFFSVDAALGPQIDERQTPPALQPADALQAPDAGPTWRVISDALTPLEQLEAVFARAEYPPFDRWYHETWIRAGLQRNNPHRAYVQLRAFIASDGRSRLQAPPGFGQPPPAAGANPTVRTP